MSSADKLVLLVVVIQVSNSTTTSVSSCEKLQLSAIGYSRQICAREPTSRGLCKRHVMEALVSEMLYAGNAPDIRSKGLMSCSMLIKNNHGH